jgi:hypothetical protein
MKCLMKHLMFDDINDFDNDFNVEMSEMMSILKKQR